MSQHHCCICVCVSENMSTVCVSLREGKTGGMGDHHHHQSLKREDHWGTTDDSATSFLHFSLFSTALWDWPNSRPGPDGGWGRLTGRLVTHTHTHKFMSYFWLFPVISEFSSTPLTPSNGMNSNSTAVQFILFVGSDSGYCRNDVHASCFPCFQRTATAC